MKRVLRALLLTVIFTIYFKVMIKLLGSSLASVIIMMLGCFVVDFIAINFMRKRGLRSVFYRSNQDKEES